VSIEWVSYALDSGPEDPLDRFVFLAIGERVNKNALNGEAWPSVMDIIARTRLSRSTVLRSIKNLERAGWMDVRKGHGPSNSSHYFLKKVSDRHHSDDPKVSDRHHSDDPKVSDRHHSDDPKVSDRTQRCPLDAKIVSDRRANGLWEKPEPEVTGMEPEGEPSERSPSDVHGIAARVLSVGGFPQDVFDLAVEAIEDIAVQQSCNHNTAGDVLIACIAEASKKTVVDRDWLSRYRWEDCETWWLVGTKKQEVRGVQQAQR
jgi:hypothetical protein